MKELGIYVHIPYCLSKCNYCNFNSYVGCESSQPDYLKALIQEIQNSKQKLSEYNVTSIYIGGGTPSSFLSGGIVSIIQTIKTNYNVDKNCEISIEANPNTITFDKVLEWKNAGINRVSVGLQSDNRRILRLLNRTHTKRDFLAAIDLLKQNGFYNINADIMIGLPTQKLSDVKRTLNTLIKCNIPHISAYCLIVEDGTPIKKMLDDGTIKQPKEIKVLKMYDYVNDFLKQNGICRYEVSNFAKPRFECRHNLNCWKMVEYIGFGAGAHSFLGTTRFYNYSGIDEYIKAIKDTGSAIELSEPQTNNDLFEEYVMLKLRTTSGISFDYIKKNYNIDLKLLKANKISQFEKLGLISVNGDTLKLTDNGFNVLNKIILELVY